MNNSPCSFILYLSHNPLEAFSSLVLRASHESTFSTHMHDALSPEEQQKIIAQMYPLMEKQVQSYHKHRHMGNNSSVPVELAQELMESIEYTINQVGGVYAHRNVEEALRLGQEILEDRLKKAKSMLELVTATAPHWQTECRWESLQYLEHCLEQYDHLHLAHRGPDDLSIPY